MPLLKCPDCGTDFSDQAPACPKCARPNRPASNTQVIEQTGKGWKRMQVVGCLTTVIGISVGAAIASTGSTAGQIIGSLVLGFGLVGGIGTFFAARIGAWWHHG